MSPVRGNIRTDRHEDGEFYILDVTNFLQAFAFQLFKKSKEKITKKKLTKMMVFPNKR